MADLTFIEKAKLEDFLGMKSGYVMDFSDRTFQEFIGEATGIDIYHVKYNYRSGSKANRLREFWKIEPNYIVGKLLGQFLDYWLSKVHTGQLRYDSVEDLYKECLAITERLKQGNVVEHINAIQAISDDRDFKLLARSIRESIEKNEPESALDRLHTFAVRFVRELCDSHKILYAKSDSLNSVYGKYVKYITDSKLIESIMTERILKYSIHVLEAFNDIRNNKSFAHDNPLLNYHESILIFNNVSNTIKFIQFLENKNKKATQLQEKTEWDDLPF
jgi:hypothetical protein